MTKRRRRFVRRVFVLGLLGWGAWFFCTRWWPQHNLQHVGGQLESAVNQELTRSGITDRDVLSQVNKEHTQRIIRWVETQRTLRVPNAQRAQEVSKGLERVADRQECSFDSRETSSGLEISDNVYVWVIQRISLVTATAQAPANPRVSSQRTPQVAFVIDDVAYETASMDHFASLGIPLTFAILPREKHSAQLAHKANAMNFPVMLHLPMEPLDLAHNDPGPSGLYLKMNEQQLKTQFDKDFASVPNLVGINNHMGSAFTENEPKMTLVMEWVKKRGVYFLDSRTTGHSVVQRVAKRVGVPCLANETFLDNADDVKSIEKQLDLVLKLAVKEGQTIAIGHYRRKFLVQALADKIPEFKARGVEIVTLPSLFHR